MNTLKTLALVGLLMSASAYFYMLWLMFEGSGQKLASMPSLGTIISLFALLVLWTDRLYRLVLNKDSDRPLLLKRKWAKDALIRLVSWMSNLIASGTVLVLALFYLPAEAAIVVAIFGFLLFGIPMFCLETHHFRARPPLQENG
ncbi:MAG: hypothetical protein WD397_07050 [Wenzhouxiangellaceae bacterium]